MNTTAFADKYGGYWEGEVPEHPVSDWQYEVNNGDTRAGYWDWAQDKLETDG